MTRPAKKLPSFGVIQAALRRTSEHLVREVVAPSPQTPAWTDFEWIVAKSVSDMQGIAALLANRLRWQPPSAFKAFLDDQLAHGRARHEQADVLLRKLDSALRGLGVAAVALKGSAMRALGLHGAGERPMGDIDLLVRPADTAACARVLGDLDYELLYSSRRHDVFAPRARQLVREFGEHRNHALKVEVHTRVYELLPVREIDITHAIWSQMPHAGLNSYASAAALLRHVLLHAANCLRANAARFIQIYDIALLAKRMKATDWTGLLGDDGERTWWMFPPLALASRYVPGSVPAEILAHSRDLCTHWLRLRYASRELHDVTWCNLRIAALPGVEWSRTPGDVLRFVRSRLLPDRVARAELADTAVSQPALMQLPWYGISHTERVVRWLFTRPPRVQTISAIAAAVQAEAP
ncbi:MAG TPA: nucleotidyltransferase family protein [Steroidobacteraceae bacterium]|nr:nucleotidyltransferase family protein [Steroidobacteraceae bacterium]